MSKDENQSSESKISARWKDTFRTIWKTKMRFFAILLMTMLGAAVFIGLVTSGPNMRKAMDQPLNQSNREHIRISSPLGLYEEDKDIIENIDEVSAYDYLYQGDFYLGEDSNQVIRVQSYTDTIAKPHITEGRLPQAENELLMDTYAQEELGLEIGDTIKIRPEEEDASSSSAETSSKGQNSSEDTSDSSSAEASPEESSEENENTDSDFSIDTDLGDVEDLEIDSPIEENTLSEEEFTIVGFADHVYYMSEESRGRTLMGDGSVDYFAIVPRESFTKDRPDMALLRMEALEGLDTSSDAYREKEQALVDEIQPLFQNRPEEILENLQADAQDQLDEGRDQVDQGRQSLEDAEQSLADAQKEIDDGWQAYEDGLITYEEAISQAEESLSQAKEELDSSKALLDEAEAAYATGLDEYNAGVQDIESAYSRLEDSYAQLAQGQEALDQGKAELANQGVSQEGLDQARENLASGQEQIDQGMAQIEAGFQALPSDYQSLIDNGLAPPELIESVNQLHAQEEALQDQEAILDESWAQIQAGQAALDEITSQEASLEEGWAQYEEGLAAYNAGHADLETAQATLEEKRQELDQGWAQYEDGLASYNEGVAQLESEKTTGQEDFDTALADLEEGEASLEEGQASFDEEKTNAEDQLAEADQKIADAEEAVQDIKVPAYSVEGRYNDYLINSELDGASNMDTLTLLFPTVFYLVAMLTTLTTITRMVDEERTQIGTLKALGLSRGSIASKYLAYAAFSSFLGTALGILLGYYLLMPVIVDAYTGGMDFIVPINYELPIIYLILAFVIGVGLSILTAFWSTYRTLQENAANLMRPKPPANGNRILIEKIKPLWNRLGFMTKVTFRNLTAKKSRMFMTLLGVFGSTALIIMGFGLRNSVQSMMDKQFEVLQNYDLEVSYNPEADQEDLDQLFAYVDDKSKLATSYFQALGSFENKNGLSENFSLLVPKDIDTFLEMRPVKNRRTQESYDLSQDTAFVTEQLVRSYGEKEGEKIRVKDASGFSYNIPAQGSVEQYIGHFIFMNGDIYRQSYGEEPLANSLIFQLKDGEDMDKVAEELQNMDAVQFTLTSTDSQDTVSDLLDALNIVVLVIILISTLLAFVVLYNLTNLNVSERQRELSTIKVLGFQDKEVTEYVYRETLILTVLGILLGALGGRLLHYAITMALSPSNALIDPDIDPIAYLIGAIIIFAFSLIVMVIIHRQLKNINMVEALKAED